MVTNNYYPKSFSCGACWPAKNTTPLKSAKLTIYYVFAGFNHPR